MKAIVESTSEPTAMQLRSERVHAVVTSVTDVLTKHMTDEALSFFEAHPKELFSETLRVATFEVPQSLVCVFRAEKYIRAHLGEELSLEGVAKTSGMSTFYFCKKFHAVTGLRFTEYVSRERVRVAQEILRARPKVRMKDVAFPVGFCSMTDFNRVFKKIDGRTPTEYSAMARSASTSRVA